MNDSCVLLKTSHKLQVCDGSPPRSNKPTDPVFSPAADVGRSKNLTTTTHQAAFPKRTNDTLSGHWTELATCEKTVFALEPIRRTVPTTITRMTANMTAYSAMSCPFSSRSNLWIVWLITPPVENEDIMEPNIPAGSGDPWSVRGRRRFPFLNRIKYLRGPARPYAARSRLSYRDRAKGKANFLVPGSISGLHGSCFPPASPQKDRLRAFTGRCWVRLRTFVGKARALGETGQPRGARPFCRGNSAVRG